MSKFLTLSAAVAALCAVAVSTPASAAEQKADGLHNGQAASTEFSARVRHHRYYRHYSNRYYGPRYYSRPYYSAPYAYAYGPRYYPSRHYYRRPGVSFNFGF
jgi:hypothetical protein